MARVLVLNASYEPLSVVTDKRAIVLVLREKAAVVVERPYQWHSETMKLVVPSVIRLIQFVKVPYRATSPVTRQAVFGRDGHRCQYCEGPAESIDHVLPRSRGGAHTWDNVVACCRSCNTRKGDRLPEEAGFRLLRKPDVPRSHAWVYARAGHTFDPLWQEYLRAG